MRKKAYYFDIIHIIKRYPSIIALITSMKATPKIALLLWIIYNAINYCKATSLQNSGMSERRTKPGCFWNPLTIVIVRASGAGLQSTTEAPDEYEDDGDDTDDYEDAPLRKLKNRRNKKGTKHTKKHTKKIAKKKKHVDRNKLRAKSENHHRGNRTKPTTID